VEDKTSDFFRRVRKAVGRKKEATRPRHVRLSAWKRATPAGHISIKFTFLLPKFVNTFRPVKMGLKKFFRRSPASFITASHYCSYMTVACSSEVRTEAEETVSGLCKRIEPDRV
jgi:hypothetical protein